MKALVILMLTILAINVSYASYGEDQKGQCIKGKDSSRGQESIATKDSTPKKEESKKKSSSDQ